MVDRYEYENEQAVHDRSNAVGAVLLGVFVAILVVLAAWWGITTGVM